MGGSKVNATGINRILGGGSAGYSPRKFFEDLVFRNVIKACL